MSYTLVAMDWKKDLRKDRDGTIHIPGYHHASNSITSLASSSSIMSTSTSPLITATNQPGTETSIDPAVSPTPFQESTGDATQVQCDPTGEYQDAPMSPTDHSIDSTDQTAAGAETVASKSIEREQVADNITSTESSLSSPTHGEEGENSITAELLHYYFLEKDTGTCSSSQNSEQPYSNPFLSPYSPTFVDFPDFPSNSNQSECTAEEPGYDVDSEFSTTPTVLDPCNININILICRSCVMARSERDANWACVMLMAVIAFILLIK